VLTPLRTVGDTVVPVLLFALGCQLSSLGRPRLREALVPVLLRMAGGAAAGLLFVLLASPSQAVARTVLLGCSMPPAIQTYVLCARVDADPGIAASGVVLGTLVAAVTIPVLVPLIVLYI
ncbi:MAG: AEC family transporter, partial [Deltaproteobacteria bacterium]|nr:AEC family transporter [Deltaproteobacteria bacterium]